MTDPTAVHLFADGFLSKAVREVKAVVHRKYPSEVELAYMTNRYAVAIQHELDIHLDRLEEALGAALYAHTLAFTQSSSLLLEHGLPVQARTVLRAALESLFQLAALAKDQSIARSLLASHDADRRTLADRIRRWRDPALRASIDSKLPDSDFAAMSSGAGKATNIYELAKLADMEDWYRTLYTLLSFSAHSKVSDLDQHVVLDDAGEPVEFQNEPDTSDQESVWLWGIEIQLAAMHSVATIFSMTLRDVETLRQHLAQLTARNGA